MKLVKLIVFMLLAFVEICVASEPVNLLVDGRLEKPCRWKLHRAKVVPARNETNSVVEFLGTEYNCIYKNIPLGSSWPKKVTLELVARIESYDKSVDKPGFGMACSLKDLLGKNIKSASRPAWQNVKLDHNTSDWQTRKLEITIPEQAKAIDVRFASRCPAKLEVKSFRLYADGVDVARAAAMGIPLESMKVPGGGESDASVKITYSQNVPYEISAAFWKPLPRYKLRETESNKSMPTADDIDAYFKIACDNDAIYVLMVATDDMLNFAPPSASNRDGFEFYINPTGALDSGGGYKFKDMQIIATCNSEGDRQAVLSGYRLKGRALGLEIKRKIEGRKLSMLLRVPFKTDGWEFAPFNGMSFTGNVMYNDADKEPQENKYSFSEDPQGLSWKDTSKFTSFEIVTDEALSYAPVVLPYLVGSSAPVDANFEGYFNLERGDCSKGTDNFSFWMREEWLTGKVDNENCHGGIPSLCLDSAKLEPNLKDRAHLISTMFNVQPGEKVKVEFFAKYAGDGKPPVPGVAFLTRANWKIKPGGIWPAVLSEDWQKFTGTIEVPKDYCKMNRQVRILGTFKNMFGNKVWISERKISRMTPIPLDAKITVDRMFSHFAANDNDKKIMLHFYNSGEAGEYMVNARISNYLGGEEKLSRKWKLNLSKDEGKSFPWEFKLAEKGFFDVELDIVDPKSKLLLMRRNLAFTVGTDLDGYTSPFYGTWSGDYKLPIFDSSGDFFAFIRQCGISKFFIGNAGAEVKSGVYDFDLTGTTIERFNGKGFEVSTKVGQCAFGTSLPDQDSDKIYTKCFQTTRHYGGKIKDICYANEPNLVNGWKTGPDGREWANAYRVVYNAFKNGNPNIKVSLGDLNNIPLEYLKAYHSQNGSYFHDDIVGIHPYRYDYDNDAFENLVKEREGVMALFANCEVRDTESGAVYKNYPQLMNLVAKKTPTLMAAGVKRHYFYPMIDLFCPYGDSSPLIPVINFQTHIFRDAIPVGKLYIADKVSGFLFDKDGKGLAVIWSMTGRNTTVDFPMWDESKIYGLFGNPIAHDKGAGVALDDTCVRYIDNLDVDAVMGKFRHVEAFTAPKVVADRSGYVTNPYLILEPSQGMFDRDIAVGRETVIPFVVRNDSGDAVAVEFNADGGGKMDVRLRPDKMQIAAYSKSLVEVSCRALEKFSGTALVIGGMCRGKKMVPLTLTMNTSREISAEGFSRMVTVTNNLGTPQPASIGLSLFNYHFKPAGLKAELAAGASDTLAFDLLPNRKNKKLGDKAYRIPYEIGVKGEKCEYKARGIYYAMGCGGETGAGDFANMRYTLKPDALSSEEFEVGVNILKSDKCLRILMKIHDPSPVQKGEVGEIYNEGDCVVIGFDVADLQASKIYGQGDFEFGISLKPDGKVETYTWNGLNGLESAKPAPEFVRAAMRDGEWLLYDIVIPAKRIHGFKNRRDIGFSIRGVNVTEKGKREYCIFGEGLDELRDMSRFGILKLK